MFFPGFMLLTQEVRRPDTAGKTTNDLSAA